MAERLEMWCGRLRLGYLISGLFGEGAASTADQMVTAVKTSECNNITRPKFSGKWDVKESKAGVLARASRFTRVRRYQPSEDSAFPLGD